MAANETSTTDVIKQYYPLEGAVEPLVELAKINPWTLRSVIELAMVMGIYAEQKKQWDREHPPGFIQMLNKQLPPVRVNVNLDDIIK